MSILSGQRYVLVPLTPDAAVTVTICSETTLLHLPSASGVEIIGPTAYVVSDDSPYLYLLNASTLMPIGEVQLFESQEFSSGRIPKSSKPDLECMAAVVASGGVAGLLLLGSGSRPTREVGYFVALSASGSESAPHFVQRLDLALLYAQLRAQLPAGTILNIEAAATTATELLLWQRSVGSGPALLLALPLEATLAHLLQPGQPTPVPAWQFDFELPVLDGYAAGFSGATYVGGQLLVTASVEASADAVLDGTVLGSFVGVVDVAARTATFTRLLWRDGHPHQGKVEGLAVRREVAAGHIEVLLVTDDDLGGSTALVAELRL